MPWSDSLRRFIYLKDGAVSAPFRKVTVRHGSQGKIYLLTTNQMWLLETNPDLDMGKSISHLELQQAVFGQQLRCEAFQQCLQGSDAPGVMDVAVKWERSTIEQRKEVSKSLDIELRQLVHACLPRKTMQSIPSRVVTSARKKTIARRVDC